MRKQLIAALLGGLVVAGSVQAEESSVLEKTKAGVVHVGQVTAHGIERGATAAGHGIKVGLTAAGHGIERGVQATKRAFGKVADKLGGSSSG